MARPTLLTPEIVAEVAELVPVVLYLETVADYIGVERTTWRKWLKRGRKEAKRLANPRAKPSEAEAPYLEFFHTYKKALADGEIRDLRNIRDAGASGQWQASAWRAERRSPRKWGKRDVLEHRGDPKRPVVISNVEAVKPADADAG
jgi:hypothetical protein